MGDINCHECNLSHFNARLDKWLKSPEGQFLTYVSNKMIHASDTANLPLAES
jgi:hypothetical protein